MKKPHDIDGPWEIKASLLVDMDQDFVLDSVGKIDL